MKLTDCLFVLKNRIFKKDNILLVIILSLIFVGIFACITMMNFVSTFRTSMLSSALGRTLVIDKPVNEVLKRIEDMEHIDVIDSLKYKEGVELVAEQFDTSKVEGIVELKALIDDKDVKIIKGNNIVQDGDIICPVRFYPYSLFTGTSYNVKTDFYESYLLDANKLIGKNITLENSSGKFNYKVVGTFENKILESSSACYVSKQDFDKVRDNIDYCSDDICYEFSSLIIRVDDFKNIEYVENELQKLGCPSIRAYTFDEGALSSLTYIPLFVGTIVLIISMTIIYNFFRKKIRNNQYQYGVLKSVGYTNMDVRKIAVLEGVILNCISIIISTILYFPGCMIVTNNYLHEFSYSNFFIPVPWLYIGLFVFVSIIFIIIVILYLINKRLNSCVQSLFEGV